MRKTPTGAWPPFLSPDWKPGPFPSLRPAQAANPEERPMLRRIRHLTVFGLLAAGSCGKSGILPCKQTGISGLPQGAPALCTQGHRALCCQLILDVAPASCSPTRINAGQRSPAGLDALPRFPTLPNHLQHLSAAEQRKSKNLLHQAVRHGQFALFVTTAQLLPALGAQDSSRLMKRRLRLRPTVPSVRRRTDDRRPRSGLIPSAVPEPAACSMISRRGSGCGASSGALLRSAVVFLIPSLEQVLHLRWPPVLISPRRRVPRLGQEFCQP